MSDLNNVSPDSNPHYFLPQWIQPTDQKLQADLCIYGATSAGVIAAVTAAARGMSVVILNPGLKIGGMTTGGLGWTDFGKKDVIGGRSLQFYKDLGKYYGRDEEWLFEPSAAQHVMQGYLDQAGLKVHFRQYLHSVIMDGGKISAVQMLGGLKVEAKFFIDSTYEGDLLAQAGVRYHVGREANSVYGETINGVQLRGSHQFDGAVDPYVIPGDPHSGVLPYVNQRDTAPDGSGDNFIQAYNFRTCLCDDPDNMVPFFKPEGYDRLQYELGARWLATENKAPVNEHLKDNGDIRKFDRLCVSSKTDANNHGALSSDFIGANYAWPEADYALREQIFQAHRIYQQGLYWFMANDSSVPEKYRSAYAKWGYAGDEYTDTNNWPPQLYVRESRRMIGDYVLSESDTQHQRKAEDVVGFGSYTMDSHNCQRFIRDGRVLNEGDVQLPPAGPYGISYRSIVPSKDQCGNLLVPTCLSASHIAYGSVRMEPVFMVLGESAALAASIAIKENKRVQDVDYSQLRPLLEEARQVVEVK